MQKVLAPVMGVRFSMRNLLASSNSQGNIRFSLQKLLASANSQGKTEYSSWPNSQGVGSQHFFLDNLSEKYSVTTAKSIKS